MMTWIAMLTEAEGGTFVTPDGVIQAPSGHPDLVAHHREERRDEDRRPGAGVSGGDRSS
jgi:hypothetical protein